MRVLVYQDGESVCAQALDVDVMSSGSDYNQAITRLQGTMIAEMAEPGYGQIGPAPQQFQDHWAQARLVQQIGLREIRAV